MIPGFLVSDPDNPANNIKNINFMQHALVLKLLFEPERPL